MNTVLNSIKKAMLLKYQTEHSPMEEIQKDSTSSLNMK